MKSKKLGVIGMKMTRRLIMFSLVSVFCAVSLISMVQSAAAAPLVLKFAGQNPPEHFATTSMNDIAKEVAQKTNNRVQIKVFPANQLGDYS
ncbi:MAG: hypothetical protein VB076_04295, partial [Synergistaceae bacterium]|nr:hypothetical protein [Synergistaceae bacterium]